MLLILRIFIMLPYVYTRIYIIVFGSPRAGLDMPTWQVLYIVSYLNVHLLMFRRRLLLRWPFYKY